MNDIILEVRGLTPKEAKALQPVLAKTQDFDGKTPVEQAEVMESVLKEFFDLVYPDKQEELFPAEQLAVYLDTLKKTGEIRVDRIKNLNRQFAGNLNEQIIAPVVQA